MIFFFLLKILVIGLKPSLKVWMTFPYGRVSKPLHFFLAKRPCQEVGGNEF